MDHRRRSRRRPKLEDGDGAPGSAARSSGEEKAPGTEGGLVRITREEEKRKQRDRVTSPTAESSGAANSSRRPEFDGDGASA
jgi:hypothetical protein